MPCPSRYGIQVVVCSECWDGLQEGVAAAVKALEDRKALDKISGETENVVEQRRPDEWPFVG